MSKNFTAKTSPKWLLWSIITAVIVLAGIIVMAFAGLNKANDMKSSSTLTISISMSSTFYEDEQANIEAIAEQEIAKAGLKVVDSYAGEKSLQLHELVYVFEKDTDLTAVKDALQATLKNTEAYKTNYISVMANENEVLETVAGGESKFLARSFVAIIAAAVLAFAYVTLRFKIWNGIVAFVAAMASSALTVAIAAIVRIPVMASSIYAVAVSMLLSVLLSVFFSAKNSKAEKANGALTDAEALSEAVPVCDVAKLSGAVAVAAIAIGVVGAFTAISFVWFAVATLVGVFAATYSALVLAPSVYLALRTEFAKLEAERARYDYKKGKKSKKEEKPVVAEVKTEE